MVLTKPEILKYIEDKSLNFNPELDGFQMQPHAVDLRLGYDFRLPKNWKLTKSGREAITIDPLQLDADNFESLRLKPGQYFELLPKEFIIASTLEEISIKLDDVMAVLYPRSSINRRGLAVDLSGIIDVGYEGKLVIPLVNNTNDQIIRIYPGERICQIVFQKLNHILTKEEQLMHGLNQAKYHGQADTRTRIDKSEEIELIKAGKLTKLKEKYPL